MDPVEVLIQQRSALTMRMHIVQNMGMDAQRYVDGAAAMTAAIETLLAASIQEFLSQEA